MVTYKTIFYLELVQDDGSFARSQPFLDEFSARDLLTQYPQGRIIRQITTIEVKEELVYPILIGEYPL